MNYSCENCEVEIPIYMDIEQGLCPYCQYPLSVTSDDPKEIEF